MENVLNLSVLITVAEAETDVENIRSGMSTTSPPNPLNDPSNPATRAPDKSSNVKTKIVIFPDFLF